MDLKGRLLSRTRGPAEPATDGFDDLGGAGQAKAQSAAGLSPAEERVEQVSRLAGADPLAGIAEATRSARRPCRDERTWTRPPGGVTWSALRSRISARCRRASGSAQVVRWRRRPRRPAGRRGLGTRRSSPGAGPRAVRSAGRAGTAAPGGRATNIRSRRMRWARCAWLRMMRSERDGSASWTRARSNCARPTITASGLLSSWPAPAANSARASSFPCRSRASSVSTCRRSGPDDRLEPSLQPRRSASRAAHESQARSVASDRRGSRPSARGAPQFDRGPRMDLRAQRQHDRARTCRRSRGRRTVPPLGPGPGPGVRRGDRRPTWALAIQPDHPGRADPGLPAPASVAARSAQFLGRLGRIRLGHGLEEAVAAVLDLAQARPVAAGAGRSDASSAPRGGWRRRRRRAGRSGLDLGHQDPEPGLARASARDPAAASDQGVCSAHRYASWRIASRSGLGGGVQSAAVDRRGARRRRRPGDRTPALGKPAAEVGQVRAQVVVRFLGRRRGSLRCHQSRSHSGSTAADGPAAQAAESPAAASTSGSGSPASRASRRAAMPTATACRQSRPKPRPPGP